MIDHMTFRVRDLERSKRFFAAALAPLGYAVCVEQAFDGVRMVGLGQATPQGRRIDTWLVEARDRGATSGCHLAWASPDRSAVDAFHAAAIAAGGTDNGAPGPRPHYHANYYGAFVLDPDGNNIEAVCQAAP